MEKGLFKTIAIMVFSFFVVSCCHGNKQVNLNNYKTRSVEAKNATVFIQVSGQSDSGTLESSGTGVGVTHVEDKTIVMTAGHICKSALDPTLDSSEMIVYTIDGSGHYAGILAISEHFDLCLVSINEVIPIANIANAAPETGDKVYYSGYPVGFYMPGTLHHFQGYMAGVDMVGDHLYNIPAIGGSSGSPIYNDNGEIVAILSAVMVDFHWMTFAVGTDNIIDFMEISGY